MAVPDPLFSTPRIMKVLEPSAGQYEVIVRMDPTMASNFPDKPFGTAISAIGLAGKDSDKYPDYTLVSIEPADKGAKDHYWIFQKLGGPEWTTTSNSKESLTPQKYRGQTVVVKTEQEVAPNTTPTTLAGNLVSSVVTQTPNTGKAVLTDITETITENVIPLAGEEYGDIVTKSVSEVLVVDGTPADTGLNVISSVVQPIGNGKSVKQTKTAKGGWPDPVENESSKEAPNLIPAKFRKSVTRSKTTKKLGAIPGAISLTGNETAKNYKRETPDRVEETTVTEVLDNSVASLPGKQMTEYGIADTTESLVDEASVPTADMNTLSLSQEPLGNGKSVLNKSVIASFPELKGTEIMAPFNIPVTVTKKVVAAGTLGSVNGDTIIEVKPMDKWRSIQITSKILWSAAEETFTKDVRYQFPDQLMGINHVIVFSENLANALAHEAMLPHIIDGPSGSFNGRVVRTFSVGPPTSADETWRPVPKRDVVIWAKMVLFFGKRYFKGTLDLRPTIHSDLDNIPTLIVVPGITGQAPSTNSLRFGSTNSAIMNATNVTTLPESLSEVLIDRSSERVRGNIWVLEKTYITMP